MNTDELALELYRAERRVLEIQTTLGHCLQRLDRGDDGWRARAAVAWWSRLAQLHPADFRDTYLQQRARLTQLYVEHGRDVSEAITAEHDAACTQLSPADPPAPSRPPSPAAGLPQMKTVSDSRDSDSV